MRIEIPETALVALVGVSGSGKTTFAERHFKPTEVLSADRFRALVSNDENDQGATSDAFDALYSIAAMRLRRGLLTVVDATNVQQNARKAVLRLAKEQNCHAVAIVLNVPERTCAERNARREDRSFGSHVIKRQGEQLRRSIKRLRKEGFRYVFVLESEDDIAEAQIVRTPLWNNRKGESGPFDIIGDVHGCYDELCALLEKLGYAVDRDEASAAAPPGRTAVFLGDLCDRGPRNVEVLRLVMSMARAGSAYCVAGNHDVKLLRKLRGSKVQLTHGLDATCEQLERESDGFVQEVKAFLDSLISHYVFDQGKLVVAHAGLKEQYQGRGSGRVRDFCLYGETAGETDEYGLPVRLPWADEYRGRAMVVYGHTPTLGVEAVNNTYCIDTGCVFGGKLTALRYPERELVQVPALQEYYAPIKPLKREMPEADGMLSIDDVLGERHISTRLRRTVTIRPVNSAAALETMSRFAVDPRWLIYLPPTMSPCETSPLEGLLEHPAEAFAYYRKRGVGQVVCEQKHMGSRAVIVLCKDEQAATRRFKAPGGIGIVHTRTGRRFFDSGSLEDEALNRLSDTLAAQGFWEDFATDWVCLDAEIMPWSAKARTLLQEQYAPVGCAGRNALAASIEAVDEAVDALRGREATLDEQAKGREDLAALGDRLRARKTALDRYTDAYRRYCWEADSIDDYRIAPFHLLATEGRTWCDQTHLWHMGTVARYLQGDALFMATDHLLVDLRDEAGESAGTIWWENLTASGGEGMVVKPLDFVSRAKGEVLQPAIKCRGREYLRIVYGPEYLLAGNLERLKERSLSKKRSLALREFALGMESLERFVREEPLHRVHECVFGVLALESEPVDPRL